MEQKLVGLLNELGLQTKEAKTYVAVLQAGEATVQDIAAAAGIKRTSLYVILRRLQQRGFVYQANRQKKTVFVAEEPKLLTKQLSDRLGELGSELTTIQSLRGHQSPHSRVLFFNSFEGFQQIWHTIFQSGVTEYQIITDPREMLNFVRKDYITKRIIKEKLRLGIRSRQLIMPSTYAAEITEKDKQENRVSRVLPYDLPVPFTTIIFGERVALISPFQEDLIIIIESRAFAMTQRALFEALWQHLPRRMK